MPIHLPRQSRAAPHKRLIEHALQNYREQRTRLYALVFLTCLSAIPCAWAGQPFFDAHLHYNAEDLEKHPPEKIVSILANQNLSKAVVTGRPPEQALLLYERAPSLILPILGVYRTQAEKQTWMNDSSLPKRVENSLAEGKWRGIGELHIFATDRRSPVFLRIVELAAMHSVPLLMHCDPAVIDTLFAHAPEAKVVWAHAGTFPYPSLLRDYLGRYPNLYIDLSVRDDRVAPFGTIAEPWEWILMEFSDRFLVGIDTYRTERWDSYPKLVKKTQTWLDQLPLEASAAISYRNGERIFANNHSD